MENRYRVLGIAPYEGMQKLMSDLAEDYRMTLVSKGQAGEPVESSTNENCYHEKVTYWDSLANKYVTEGRNFPVEVHHYTTTIQWTRGTISKGVSRDES